MSEMLRNLDALTAEDFDLRVIGGVAGAGPTSAVRVSLAD